MYTWYNKQRPNFISPSGMNDELDHLHTEFETTIFKMLRGKSMQKESDPHNIPQHSPGAKLDSGKQIPYTVLGAFAPALQEVTRVGTYGANKYTKHGWISVPNGKERYYEAMLRHLLEDMKTTDSVDPETQITHLAHAAWNILAILTLRANERNSKVPLTVSNIPQYTLNDHV